MAVKIKSETIIIIWISAVVSAILSNYLLKQIFVFTKFEFINLLLTASILGLWIIFIVFTGLKLLRLVY